jgi:hypothetical protein
MEMEPLHENRMETEEPKNENDSKMYLKKEIALHEIF